MDAASRRSLRGMTTRAPIDGIGTVRSLRRAPPDEDSFADATNRDPEIQAHGKYFTCSYLLDMDDHRVVVRVVSGKVVAVFTSADGLAWQGAQSGVATIGAIYSTPKR